MIYHMSAEAVETLRNEIDYQRYRADVAEDAIDRVRQALGGYPDSDLVSLAETLRARCDALESALAAQVEQSDGLRHLLDYYA